MALDRSSGKANQYLCQRDKLPGQLCSHVQQEPLYVDTHKMVRHAVPKKVEERSLKCAYHSSCSTSIVFTSCISVARLSHADNLSNDASPISSPSSIL